MGAEQSDWNQKRTNYSLIKVSEELAAWDWGGLLFPRQQSGR